MFKKDLMEGSSPCAIILLRSMASAGPRAAQRTNALAAQMSHEIRVMESAAETLAEAIKVRCIYTLAAAHRDDVSASDPPARPLQHQFFIFISIAGQNV